MDFITKENINCISNQVSEIFHFHQSILLNGFYFKRKYQLYASNNYILLFNFLEEQHRKDGGPLINDFKYVAMNFKTHVGQI